MVALNLPATAAAVTLLLLTSWPCDALQRDLKVPYYSSNVLHCGDNVTELQDVSRLFWITPDAQVIDNSTDTTLLPPHVQMLNASTINVTRADEDRFGYYTCVIIHNDHRVTVFRWGLNVDGADFSELEDHYKHSAVIGAIAAGVVLAVVGGGCLIRDLRYKKRGKEGKEGEDFEKTASSQQFENGAFVSPLEEGVEGEAKTNGPVAGGGGGEGGLD